MDCLVQHASGDHIRLLDIGRDRHAEYAKRHGLGYRATTGRKGARLHAMWDKELAILDALHERADGAIVVWLDADCLIVGDEDLRTALPDGMDVGMVRNTWGHLNAGAIWLRNSVATRALISAVYARGPMPPYGLNEDQPRLNSELRYAGLLAKTAILDSRWNDYASSASRPTPPTQVRGWHNLGWSVATKAGLMGRVADKFSTL